MKKEDLMKLLRNPAKYRAEKKQLEQKPSVSVAPVAPGKAQQDKLLAGVGIGVVGLVCLTLIFFLSARNRADNLTPALDPAQVNGLTVAETEFNPHQETLYVEVQEGQNRNATVSNLGSTLPIISRFNFRSFTPKNYQLIGAAPWALTTNFSSNLNDPDLIRYLLANDTMIQAFLVRPDVAPLLEDPQMLLAFTQDSAALADFFNSDTVQSVLSNEKMVRAVAGSRFMSYLLISKAVKYFRDRPQEAAKIIAENPYLSAVRQNPHVRVAVLENRYLKDIAPILLDGKTVAAVGKKPTPSAPKKSSSVAKKRTGK